jgi:glutathione S-transferase
VIPFLRVHHAQMAAPMHTPLSMSTIVLYSARLSMFGAKVQIALHEKHLPFELVMVPFTQAAGYAPKHPEVARINPKKQVPVLVHGDLELFDSTQIFEYLEDFQPSPRLWPDDVEGRARARLIEHQSDEVYFPHIARLMGLQNRMDDPLALSSVAAANDFHAQMEGLLVNNDYLAGQFSFADIALYMALLFGARMGADLNDLTPRLQAWRDRISTRPAIRQVVRPMAAYLRSDGRPLPPFLAVLADDAAE